MEQLKRRYFYILEEFDSKTGQICIMLCRITNNASGAGLCMVGRTPIELWRALKLLNLIKQYSLEIILVIKQHVRNDIFA